MLQAADAEVQLLSLITVLLPLLLFDCLPFLKKAHTLFLLTSIHYILCSVCFMDCYFFEESGEFLLRICVLAKWQTFTHIPVNYYVKYKK